MKRLLTGYTALALTFIMLCALPPNLGARTQGLDETAPAFNREELAQMVAPIALYPDVLLSQILIAAAYPFEVAEADRWISRNTHLAGEALDRALLAKDWDVSVLSLCHYPKVLTMMSENLGWTAELGNAFVAQQPELMDTVQDLRAKAVAQGNLVCSQEQKIIVEERIVRIEPVHTTYLHIPVYDPFLVYGPWWYPAYMPYRIYYPGVVVIGPRIVFSSRLHVGFGVIGWSMFDWPARNVVIVNIDNTKRYNRHYHVYKSPHRVNWQPAPRKRPTSISTRIVTSAPSRTIDRGRPSAAAATRSASSRDSLSGRITGSVERTERSARTAPRVTQENRRENVAPSPGISRDSSPARTTRSVDAEAPATRTETRTVTRQSRTTDTPNAPAVGRSSGPTRTTTRTMEQTTTPARRVPSVTRENRAESASSPAAITRERTPERAARAVEQTTTPARRAPSVRTDDGSATSATAPSVTSGNSTRSRAAGTTRSPASRITDGTASKQGTQPGITERRHGR